jgi:hypothetical protein
LITMLIWRCQNELTAHGEQLTMLEVISTCFSTSHFGLVNMFATAPISESNVDTVIRMLIDTLLNSEVSNAVPRVLLPQQ